LVAVVVEHTQETEQAYLVVLVAAAVINLLMAALVHKHQAQVDQLVMDFLEEEAVLLGQVQVVAELAELGKAQAELCVIRMVEKVVYQEAKLL
jgi:hypothetical protein